MWACGGPYPRFSRKLVSCSSLARLVVERRRLASLSANRAKVVRWRRVLGSAPQTSAPVRKHASFQVDQQMFEIAVGDVLNRSPEGLTGLVQPCLDFQA